MQYWHKHASVWDHWRYCKFILEVHTDMISWGLESLDIQRPVFQTWKSLGKTLGSGKGLDFLWLIFNNLWGVCFVCLFVCFTKGETFAIQSSLSFGSLSLIGWLLRTRRNSIHWLCLWVRDESVLTDLFLPTNIFVTFLHSKPIPKGDHLTYKYNQTFQTVLDLMMIY